MVLSKSFSEWHAAKLLEKTISVQQLSLKQEKVLSQIIFVSFLIVPQIYSSPKQLLWIRELLLYRLLLGLI